MSDDSESALRARLGQLHNWFHVPSLIALFAYMLWVRIQSASNFFVNGEILYNGNDAWYHLRQVQYTVSHWPKTMPYDAWTYFPYGTEVGQFGTVFDQLIATAALILGLGSPTDHLIREVLLYAPAVFGALIIVPTYLIGKRLGGRSGGVFAGLVLAVLPGQFLARSLIGFADHNIAEPLFQSIGVIALMLAITAGERDRIIWEQVLDRDITGMRRTLLWSVIAGFGMALYVWTWPPGVLLIGIAGVFFAIKLALDYLRGISPDHVAAVAVISMGTTAVLTFLNISTFSFSSTDYSLVQPFVAIVIAIGAVFMAWLAREWDGRDLDRSLYPVTIAGIAVAGTILVAVLFPRIYGFFLSNITNFLGFGVAGAQATIQEAQPFLQGQGFTEAVFSYYGFAFFSAIVGALVMLYQAYEKDTNGEELFVIVWALFITSAAFTQVRFNYYLAVPVAVLNAPLIGLIVERELVGFGWGNVRELGDVTGAQVLTIGVVFLVIIAPLTFGVSGSSLAVTPATQIGANTGPSGGYLAWEGSLEWLEDNTPEEGNWNNSGNQDELPYYGTFPQQADFDYPRGAYGVMSWWDYGHWITYTGERIPNANPFQQGATQAANFLLSQSEEASLEVLREVSEDDAQTRYIMLDHQLGIVSGRSKFAAPIQFQTIDEELTASDYYTGYYQLSEGQYQFAGFLKSMEYWNSTVNRLFRLHGSAAEPSTTVYTWGRSGKLLQGSDLTVRLAPQSGNGTRTFQTYEAARAFANNRSNAVVGGFSAPSRYVPALEHYRLVKSSAATTPRSVIFRELFGDVGGNNYAFTKVFERVPGATVQVEGPANTEITARVTMNQTTRGSPFTYVQRASTGEDGVATFTLPYSSTGYDNWGPENGHTNVSVRAEGPYTFTTGNMTEGAQDLTTVVYNATQHVSEGAVIGETDGPDTVELTRKVLDQPNGSTNSTSVAPTLDPDSEDDGTVNLLTPTPPSTQASRATLS